MIDLQSMTPTELRKLIKEQPEEVVRRILDGQTDTVTTVGEDAYHNRTHQLDITRNRYDGNLVGQQEVKWTYYEKVLQSPIVVAATLIRTFDSATRPSDR